MPRIAQPRGKKGSLRWIQQSVAERWSELEVPIVARTGGITITWLSPLSHDEFAEYRDGDFLDRLALSPLRPALKASWPDRGPQWDALGTVDNGAVLLVEAKAHVAELCSPGTAARRASLERISRRLDGVALALGALETRSPWTRHFYQLANRIAHLHFLRTHGVNAWLILVNFLGDEEMGGPDTAAVWEAAYTVAWHVMGIGRRHELSRYIVEVYPDMRRRSEVD